MAPHQPPRAHRETAARAISYYKPLDCTSGIWEVTSASVRGRTYRVDVYAYLCPCAGFAQRGSCRHVKTATALHHAMFHGHGLAVQGLPPHALIGLAA